MKISKTALLILFSLVIICIIQVSAESPYRVLGVSKYHSMSHIKHKYKELAKKYHPDKNKGKSEAESLEIRKKFYAIQAAYESIKEEKGAGFKSANSDEQDIHEEGFDFFNSIISSLVNILLILSVLYATFYSVAFIYRLFEYVFNFIFYICVVHAFLDLFLSDYFDSQDSQNASTFLITLTVLGFLRFYKRNEQVVQSDAKEGKNKTLNIENNNNFNIYSNTKQTELRSGNYANKKNQAAMSEGVFTNEDVFNTQNNDYSSNNSSNSKKKKKTK